MAYLTFPGTAGNFIETADVNLLDADTAHIQQGIGGWQSLLAVSAVGQSTDLTPQFGSQHAVGTADGGLAFVTTPQFTAGFPVTVGQAYTASVDISADTTGLQARVSIRWADGSGITVQTDNGPYVPVSQNQWVRGSASFTAPATAVYAAVRIEWDSPSASDKLYWDAGCFRQGSDASFVPSLRVSGPQVETQFRGSLADPPGAAVAYHFVRGFATAAGSHHWMNSVFDTWLYWRLSDGTNNGFDRYPVGPYQDGNRHLFVSKATWGGSSWTTSLDADGNSITADINNLASVGFPLNWQNVGGSGVSPVAIGALTTGNEPYAGTVERALYLDGIGGPVVASFAAAQVPGVGAIPNGTTWQDVTGRTWTLHGTGITKTLEGGAKGGSKLLGHGRRRFLGGRMVGPRV